MYGDGFLKKKIAVLGNAWSTEYIRIVINGIRRGISDYHADAFFFVNYSLQNDTEENSNGEANILTLSEISEYDGYILLSNTFHLQEEYEYLRERFSDGKKPVISLEYNIPGIPFYGSDNYSGMKELCEHIIDEHGVKNVVFISGPVDNAESNIRLSALKDALQERGMELPAENLLVGNWNVADAERILPSWLKSHKELPDAVVCANDMMAMGACNVLKTAGIKVPEQVIVTGFDHLSTAEAFSPSIATVGRDWDDLGYQAVAYLFDKMEGKAVETEHYVNTYAIFNESCGCRPENPDIADIMKEKRDSYNSYLSRANVGVYVCEITDTISKAVSEEELCYYMGKTRWNPHYEGDELYICLMDNFFTSLQEGEPLRPLGYTGKMDLIYGRKNNKRIPRKRIDVTKLIPTYHSRGKESKFYVLVPLYGEDGAFGYAAFGEGVSMMYDYTLYSWVRHVNMSLRNVRRGIVMKDMNRRLERLSYTDSLTGVYNRMGCENKAYPFMEECHSQGKCVAMMFADINKMKTINDSFGHIHGDTAIRTVAKAIKDVLKDDWIVVRYGGDEFLMVGECPDDATAENKLREIANSLKIQREQMQLPYKLRVSLGHVLVKPEEALNLSDCLNRAENAMYIMKKRLHAEDGYASRDESQQDED